MKRSGSTGLTGEIESYAASLGYSHVSIGTKGLPRRIEVNIWVEVLDQHELPFHRIIRGRGVSEVIEPKGMSTTFYIHCHNMGGIGKVFR